MFIAFMCIVPVVTFSLATWIGSATWAGLQRHGWWNILDELLCGSIAGCCFMLGALISLLLKPKGAKDIVSRYFGVLMRRQTIENLFLDSFTAKCFMIAAGLLVGTYCPPMFSEGGTDEQIIMSVLGLFSIAVGFACMGNKSV